MTCIADANGKESIAQSLLYCERHAIPEDRDTPPWINPKHPFPKVLIRNWMLFHAKQNPDLNWAQEILQDDRFQQVSLGVNLRSESGRWNHLQMGVSPHHALLWQFHGLIRAGIQWPPAEAASSRHSDAPLHDVQVGTASIATAQQGAGTAPSTAAAQSRLQTNQALPSIAPSPLDATQPQSRRRNKQAHPTSAAPAVKDQRPPKQKPLTPAPRAIPPAQEPAPKPAQKPAPKPAQQPGTLGPVRSQSQPSTSSRPPVPQHGTQSRGAKVQQQALATAALVAQQASMAQPPSSQPAIAVSPVSKSDERGDGAMPAAALPDGTAQDVLSQDDGLLADPGGSMCMTLHLHLQAHRNVCSTRGMCICVVTIIPEAGIAL